MSKFFLLAKFFLFNVLLPALDMYTDFSVGVYLVTHPQDDDEKM
jgi:hypothetical protein